MLSCSQKYDITLVSPRNYFLYTPLLPAVATGTVEERSIVEPIRRIMAGKVQHRKKRKEKFSLFSNHYGCRLCLMPDNAFASSSLQQRRLSALKLSTGFTLTGMATACAPA